MIALIVFVVADYVTGVMCAVIDKKLSSEVGFKGIFKKVLIFILVGLANILDVQVIGTGCAIPGVMACRTIRNERERRATAMLAPFMPCGAKLPVIALFAGAFFVFKRFFCKLIYRFK